MQSNSEPRGWHYWRAARKKDPAGTFHLHEHAAQ